MIPDLARTLDPLQDAVHRAQTALDTHNQDETANPLDGLHIAGRVIHTHQALAAACLDLLDAIGGDPETVELQIQGRLRRLAEEDRNSHTNARNTSPRL